MQINNLCIRDKMLFVQIYRLYTGCFQSVDNYTMDTSKYMFESALKQFFLTQRLRFYTQHDRFLYQFVKGVRILQSTRLNCLNIGDWCSIINSNQGQGYNRLFIHNNRYVLLFVNISQTSGYTTNIRNGMLFIKSLLCLDDEHI